MKFFVYQERRGEDAPGVPAVADLPQRKTTEAAGYDVRAFLPNQGSLELKPMQVVLVPTGLYIAGPTGSTVLVVSRSGMAAKGVLVVNGPGVIDSDYRGEVKVIMMYLAPINAVPFYINHNDRIGQLLFLPPTVCDLGVTFQTVDGKDDLPVPNSNRVGGFGSTGQQ
jgi:dUTP pyrophosphatase